jgi:DNA polymerase-3 subunit epsilon
MGATDIHGLTDDDVANAPRFEEIAGNLIQALSGCIIASYNVYFDVGFLKSEFRRIGINHLPPHICLMYMRPMLGLGKRCSLEDACKEHGINHTQAHATAPDAIAASGLWQLYSRIIADRGLSTFKDLSSVKTYKFIDSFDLQPYSMGIASGLPRGNLKSRIIPAAIPLQEKKDGRHAYWEAIKAILSDLDVTDNEVEYLAAKRRELRLTPEQFRGLHARAFSTILTQFLDDKVLDDRECAVLRRLHQCLRKIGWAPGD